MITNTEYKQGLGSRNLTKVSPKEEIVISGIAGRFPESDNVQELHKNLISKLDLVTDDDRRWKLDHPELPRTGKINRIEKFDALFFGMHSKQAHATDPMSRMLLEHAYEAIIDAGVNPKEIRGTKTGVFIGASFSESEKILLYDKPEAIGLGISGCSRSMWANRISYWLDITGPSYTIDTACSSSLYAMEHAYNAIREGHCEAAIVGGANLILQPNLSIQLFKMAEGYHFHPLQREGIIPSRSGKDARNALFSIRFASMEKDLFHARVEKCVLSRDGRCKSFDESADGYVRSEAISVAFLQKAKDAKRVYATLVHAKTNCDGFKEQGISFPSSHMQSVLLDEFYLECGVSPLNVSYCEAHCTGTKIGDLQEVSAIDKVMGRKRTKNMPLLIGSVKSNLGHAEAACGLVSVSKVLLAMESGILQPNINFRKARQDIKAFAEERIKVVSDPTPWKGGYVGINSFGFGGANCHVLLKSNTKEKFNNGEPNDDLPRLLAISGRTYDAVSAILKDLESKPVDIEYIRLFHDIHSKNINGHLYRGYTILPPHGVTDTPIREIKSASGASRPVWFIFSGLGSQWPGMGEDLLRIPVFAEAIKKCDAVLKPHDIDIFHIITNKDKTAFDISVNSFVGIAAVQIGLVDVLHSIGIKPDNIIGYSVGELGCAYADGCFTREQMIMSAYLRGLAIIETKVIQGSMAAVGLGYKSLKDLCPSDIDVACHNASDNATISGPAESMKSFVAELQAKKIFVNEVHCNNIPYHSRYIVSAGTKLLTYLKQIIPEPKPRSPKWLSTSVPIGNWYDSATRFSSAEYHTNNLLSVVLLEETAALIPTNAIAIEVGPHGLLQAILRRSLNPDVANIPLMQRGHRDNVDVLLQAIGKMFNAGLQPQLADLYPRVEYPVSRTTQMISPLIKWEHSVDWYVASYKSQQNITSGERLVKVALLDSNYEFMADYVIDGHNLFPVMGYLALIWETVGIMHSELYTDISIVFEDVKFKRATIIPKDKKIEFMLMVHKGTGIFEIVESGVVVVTGRVRETTNPASEKVKTSIPASNDDEIMTSRDVYKELRIRGYHYDGLFRSITSSTINGSKGHILWLNNWVAFMENMLQMQIFSKDTRGLFVPTGIKKITIDTGTHRRQIKFNETVKVYYNKLHEVIVSEGVEIRGLKLSAVPRSNSNDPVLEQYTFIPFADRAEVSLREIARLSIHVSVENSLSTTVKIIEFMDESDKNLQTDLLTPWIFESINKMPLIRGDISIVSTKNKFEDDIILSNVSVIDPIELNADANALLVVGYYLLTNDRAETLKLLLSELKSNGFLLTREKIETLTNLEKTAQALGLHVILEKKYGSHMFILLRKEEKLIERTLVIHVNNNKFNWVEKMRKVMTEELTKETVRNTRIFLVGQGDIDNGLMGLITSLKREPGAEIVRGILIQDFKAPEFSLQNSLYAKQIQKDLSVCVLRENGVWGTYRHLPLSSLKPKAVHHIWLNQMIRGDLSSLTWFEGPIRFENKNKDLVNIIYSTINLKDIMLATGKLSAESLVNSRHTQESVIGFEYSGIHSGGKRILGLVESRGIANMCIADRDLTWEVPNSWSLEEAATIPAAYGICYYGLYLKGKLKKSDKILIHNGSGSVGQAAINLALHEGCEIFTTVGTAEKRHFMHKHFPQITEDHIGNSRDTSFEHMIVEQTNGRGVDIVLHSLTEDKLQASLSCLTSGGRFLEVGKFDLTVNNLLEMPKENKEDLKRLMADGLKSKVIKPLTRTVFEKGQAETAFRYMADGKHIGKVILRMRDEKESISTLNLALPRYHCFEDRSYIILGGVGGFGLELADWLVLRGAKNLVLTSRTGIKNGYQKMRVELWKSYGVNMIIVAGKEASIFSDCQSILEKAAKLAPIDGIFNLAVVLKDALWENQTPDSFEEVFRPKAWATKNLDILSRQLCPSLRHFVVFSSVTSGRGFAGQTNYGMSNSVMERICERRVAEGLPGLAIQWGTINDVGLVVDMQEKNKDLLVINGTLQQRLASCLKELDGFLQQNQPVVSCMIVAEKKIVEESQPLNIVDTVLNIIGLEHLKEASLTAPLTDFGMDSIMSTVVQNTLKSEFGISLTAKNIRGLNFAKLQEMSDARKVS